MYCLCSENKGADQLRDYREARLRLCFCICKLLVFSCDGSIIVFQTANVPGFSEPTETVTVETSELPTEETVIDDTGAITMECTTVSPDVTDANDLMIQNISNIKAGESKNQSTRERGNLMIINDNYIVNYYPVTKNKPIYHIRISKQMKWPAFSEPFYLFTVRE